MRVLGEKRGQFTVFVVLGFVLLIVVLISLFLVNFIISLDLESQAQQAVRDYLQSESINYYVYTCMDSAVSESVYEFSLQGGVIYDYQNGSYVASGVGVTHIPFNVTYQNTDGMDNIDYFNVSYSILNFTNCPFVENEPPKYPSLQTRLIDFQAKYTNPSLNVCMFNQIYRSSGFFGLNNLSRLCFGNSTNLDYLNETKYLSPCARNSILIENQAVEFELAKMISDKVEGCINFSIFEDAGEGHNITVLGDPTTSIVYSDEKFSVNVEYPFRVKLQNEEPVIVSHTFEYSSDLRLTRIHNYMLTLLRYETQYAFFNITSDYHTVPGFDPGFMKVSFVNFTDCTNCPTHKFDMLLIVEDEKSKVGNRSLKFITAIKNRRPALDFIHETPPEQFYDLIVVENDTIRFDPVGIDPDEKYVIYDYVDWKETYDEEWDYSLCPLSLPLSFTNYFTCVKKKIGIPEPHNWTKSQLFIDSNRSAEYKTNRSDIGPHQVIIRVEDDSGLIDYQPIQILVMDRPFVNLTLQNLFDDVAPNTTSIEDTFIMSGKGSAPSIIAGGTIDEYIWEGMWYNPNLGGTGVGGYERVFRNITYPPNDERSIPITSHYSIQNVTLYNLSNVGEHKLTLTISSISANGVPIPSSESMIINVTECVPHRNASDPYPYPYNGGPNPFMADHVCCLATNQMDASTYSIASASSNTVCFQKDLYGEFFSLINAANTNWRMDAAFNEYTPYNPQVSQTANPSASARNNVYNLQLERECDGQRGNVCAGDLNYVLVSVDSCNYNQNYNEQCSGPSLPYSENNVQCMNYPAGQTFEERYGIGTPLGLCDYTDKCSGIGPNGYTQNGPFQCQATCNGASGLCTNTRIADCSCETSCGAVCTSSSDYSWVGKVCNFQCGTSNTCDYQQHRNLPCTNTQGTFCRSDANLNGALGLIRLGQCYYGVGCSGAAPSYSEGEMCVAGQISAINGEQYCMYGTNPSCNANGVCSLNRYRMADLPCEPTRWRCSTTTGAYCYIP